MLLSSLYLLLIRVKRPYKRKRYLNMRLEFVKTTYEIILINAVFMFIIICLYLFIINLLTLRNHHFHIVFTENGIY